MEYRSKVDWWLALVLAVPAIVVPAVAVSLVVVGGEGRATGLVMLAGWFVVMGVVWLIGFPIVYEIGPVVVRVRSGVLRSEVPIAAITEVAPTRNPLSAPAMSLDRLAIRYRENGCQRLMLVSPDDKQAFLRELATRDRGLRLEGDRLVRSD